MLYGPQFAGNQVTMAQNLQTSSMETTDRSHINANIYNGISSAMQRSHDSKSYPNVFPSSKAPSATAFSLGEMCDLVNSLVSIAVNSNECLCDIRSSCAHCAVAAIKGQLSNVPDNNGALSSALEAIYQTAFRWCSESDLEAQSLAQTYRMKRDNPNAFVALSTLQSSVGPYWRNMGLCARYVSIMAATVRYQDPQVSKRLKDDVDADLTVKEEYQLNSLVDMAIRYHQPDVGNPQAVLSAVYRHLVTCLKAHTSLSGPLLSRQLEAPGYAQEAGSLLVSLIQAHDPSLFL
jgi:hypothetical protein